jgi:DNA-binding MarR family transcriptional regulator
MENNVPVDQNYNLWVVLHQTRDTIFKLRERELREYGITPEQAATLFVVKTLGGGVTPSEISKWILREHHSISTLAKNMERKGLVRRTKGKLNKSRIHIYLTVKGEKAFSNSLKRESIKEVMSSISEEEREQLYSTLQKLRNKALQGLADIKELPFP